MRATAFVERALSRSAQRLIESEERLRANDDAEAVHDARVTALRLRCELRAFRRLLDRSWERELCNGLRRLRDEFSRVRDTDVLLERITTESERLPAADRSRIDAVLGICRQAQVDARARLRAISQEEWYAGLFARLRDGAAEPHVRPRCAKRARRFARAVIRKQFKKLRKCARNFRNDPSEARLHRLRIQTKHLRYLSEAFEEIMGKVAGRLAKRAAKLQTILGRSHDAELMYEKVRQLAQLAESMGSTEMLFLAGELAALGITAGRRADRKWRAAWRKVKRAATAACG